MDLQTNSPALSARRSLWNALLGFACALGFLCLWTWPLALGLGHEWPVDPTARGASSTAIHVHLAELGDSTRSLGRGELPLHWRAFFFPVGQPRDTPLLGLVPQLFAAPLVGLLGPLAGATVFLGCWLAASLVFAFQLGRRLKLGWIGSGLVAFGFTLTPALLLEATRGSAHMACPLIPLGFLLMLDLCAGVRPGRSAFGLGLVVTAAFGCSFGTGLALGLGLLTFGLLGPGFPSGSARESGFRSPAFLLGVGLACLPVLLAQEGTEPPRPASLGGTLAGRAATEVPAPARDPFELLRPAPLHPARTGSIRFPSAEARAGASVSFDWRRPAVAPQISWSALVFALLFGLRTRFARRCLLAAATMGSLSWLKQPRIEGFGQPWLELWPLALGFLFLSAASALEEARVRSALGRLAFWAAPCLVAFEGWVAPLQTFTAEPPPFVEEMAKLPAEGSWVLLPPSAAPHPAHGWQAWHGRPNWMPAPGAWARQAFEDRRRRAPSLFQLSHDLSQSEGAPAGWLSSELGAEALDYAVLAVALELELEGVDHVLLDTERTTHPLEAVDLLDRLPGFVRGNEAGAGVLWWARVPPLHRWEAAGDPKGREVP